MLSYLKKLFASLPEREEGQTMAEYGVVLAVVTIGAVAVFTALSGGITNAVNRVISLLRPSPGSNGTWKGGGGCPCSDGWVSACRAGARRDRRWRSTEWCWP